MRRFSPPLTAATLALSAILAGLVLSGPDAKAQTSCGTFQPPYTGTCVDSRFTLIGISGPSEGSGDIKLHDINPPATPGLVGVNVEFTPNYGAPPDAGPRSGEFRYQLLSNGDLFNWARLDSNCPLAGCNVKKYLFSDASFTTPINLSNSKTFLESINGSPEQANLLGSYTNLYIQEIYTVDATGILDNFGNTFQTPGPLPILGAGAAFGFSRKLRSRIKARP
ncbi:MAG: hypothetical protein VKP70_00425 [Cyanobacteriota bacterium]|nr:hypothetical protein [Cyanobacteriota bacterium]